MNFSEEFVRAIFLLAGLEIVKLTKINNQYHGSMYPEFNETSPWWLVQTPYGELTIGWRKHVIFIGWEKTKMILDITKDDVTKEGYYVHAWGYHKVVEYVAAWSKAASCHDSNLGK